MSIQSFQSEGKLLSLAVSITLLSFLATSLFFYYIKEHSVVASCTISGMFFLLFIVLIITVGSSQQGQALDTTFVYSALCVIPGILFIILVLVFNTDEHLHDYRDFSATKAEYVDEYSTYVESQLSLINKDADANLAVDDFDSELHFENHLDYDNFRTADKNQIFKEAFVSSMKSFIRGASSFEGIEDRHLLLKSKGFVL